jgi:hypothetical protein
MVPDHILLIALILGQPSITVSTYALTSTIQILDAFASFEMSNSKFIDRNDMVDAWIGYLHGNHAENLIIIENQCKCVDDFDSE